MTFTPYEGWEDDLRHLALDVNLRDRGSRWKRIADAFESPKCGKVLTIPTLDVVSSAGHLEWCWTQDGNGRESVPTCNLPAGHHPWRVVEGSAYERGERCCDLPGTDPIHSPGHVPDVPEEAWR